MSQAGRFFPGSPAGYASRLPVASPPFPALVGHLPARERLAATVARGRLPGALLLLGPDGVGRALLARELARALLCAAPGDRPCGACGACQRVTRGAHADLLLVRPEDQASISIDQVRDALAELALAPVEGRARVLVLDPASALSEPAQNALLKGLEEPAPRAHLVLLARGEDELLSTIVSRCGLLRLDELARGEVEEVLVRAGLPPAEAAERARWSAGSPGKALAADAPERARLAERALQALGSGQAWQDPMGLVDELAAWCDKGAADLAEKRERLLDLVRALTRAIRDGLVAGLGTDVPRMSGAGQPLLAPLAALPRERVLAALDRLGRAEEEVQENVNPTLVLEGLVLDLGEALRPGTASPGRTR